MPYRDLREYISTLEKRGMLKHVSKEVDKDWEITCIARWMFQSLPEEERYGIFFDNVKGYNVPVVTGIAAASRQMYALALEVTPEKIYERWCEALSHPLKAKIVPSGPVKEVIKKGDEVDLDELPNPVWTPDKDDGAYLSATCVITKDPQTHIQNMGAYRSRVHSKNRLGIAIRPHQHIGIHYYNNYEPANEPMPIAIAMGVDPTLLLTSVAKMGYGLDEIEVAGGLRGAPIEVVKAEMSDLYVPATAEYVIEGFVPPKVRETEGRFGEYTGFIGRQGVNPVIEVTCITHRKQPIYQGMISQMPPCEGGIAAVEAANAILYKRLVYDISEPGIKDVCFTESGAVAHALVSMTPLYLGHSMKVGVLTSHLLDANAAKIVTVVDDDIDIRDPYSVDWALSFRVNPARDVVIIDRCLAPQLDPSAGPRWGEASENERRLGSKMIIDATMKKDYPSISLPPKKYMERVLKDWDKTGLPEIKVKERTRLLLDKYPV
jgi:UbiD family decarboxylase